MRSSPLDLLIINERMFFPPLFSLLSNGPIYLASYLDSKGYAVKVIDNNSQYKKYTLPSYINLINTYKPKVLGLGVNLLNANNSYELIKKIRNVFGNLIIIGGGLHAFDSAHEMMDYGFDIVFKGEAELGLTQLLGLLSKFSQGYDRRILKNSDFINGLTKIKGILFKTEEAIMDTGSALVVENLDDLPFVDHKLANLSDFIRTRSDHYKVTNALNFQRGCPYQCTYCKAGFMEGSIRNNSAGYIFKQLKYMYETCGTEQFNIQDANFPIDKKRLHEFCNLMISSGFSKKIRLWCQTSVTIPLSDHEIAMMKESGFTMISLGIERFDTDFRKMIKKSGTVEQIFDLTMRIKQRQIKTMANILIGFPSETKESLDKESGHLEKCLPYIDYYGVHYVLPVPGTDLYNKNLICNTWYLNKEATKKRISYYEIAYNVTTPSLEFNLFKFPLNILTELRNFKETFYKKSIVKANCSILYKIAFITDMFIARLSYFVYQASPSLEDFLFSPLKFVRINGGKFFMIKFVMKAQ